jgi:hypothetical protein
MSRLYTIYFADVYGEGNYGDSVYSCASSSDPDCVTTTPGGGTTGGGSGTGGTGTSTGAGGLADTGVMIMGFGTLACIIIFVALVVRIWRRKPQLVAVRAEADQNDTPPEEGPQLPTEKPRPL